MAAPVTRVIEKVARGEIEGIIAETNATSTAFTPTRTGIPVAATRAEEAETRGGILHLHEKGTAIDTNATETNTTTTFVTLKGTLLPARDGGMAVVCSRGRTSAPSATITQNTGEIAVTIGEALAAPAGEAATSRSFVDLALARQAVVVLEETRESGKGRSCSAA